MDEEQLRHMLTEATAYEPPLGAVVDRAVHAGIRMRRRRRVMTIAGSTAAVAVVALVPALARVASPPLRPAVPHQRPVPGSRHPAMPGGELFVASQLGMITVALPSGKAGPLLTDHRTSAAQYFLPYQNTVYDYDGSAGRLYSFDTATSKAGKPIAVGGAEYGAPYGTDPMAITPDGRTLYLPNDANSTIIPVNTVTGSAGKPIRVGQEPVAMVMSPDGSTAYALGATGTLTMIRTATGYAGNPISLGAPGFAQSGSTLSIQPMAISPDGSIVYVLYMGTDSLIPVHTGTGKVGPPIKLGNQTAAPDGIVFAPDGATAYVANGNAVIPVEVRTGKVGMPIHVPGGSNVGIVITPDGTTAYALGWMLTPVNLVTRKAGPPVPAMGQPLLSIAMSPDGTTVYVSRNHAIVVVSTATNRQQRLIPTPPSEYDHRVEFSLLCHSAGMTVIDDLVAEQEWLEALLLGLTDGQWLSESGAAGWTIADVVLHLAQSEEGVAASVTGRAAGIWTQAGVPVDDRAAQLVELERAAPDAVFARWRQARRAAVAALRAADPGTPVPWVVMPMKPATLATTRLAEHWAHGIDITAPLGIDQPDTARLRHIAWLAHRTLPYALTIAGEEPVAVFCELTSPDGSEVWRYGPADAQSRITGTAGAFCRVAARRLAPDQAGLTATGPHGAIALRLLRTYAA